MNQIVTTGIVLTRTNFGEADRIITVITPDQGKLRLMAKGARRIKAKLAGGVELFSISHITFMRGKGDIGTLISARLTKHFDEIPKEINRTMLGYEVIKKLNLVTEDEPDKSWFELTQKTLEALNDTTISLETIKFWFYCQLLKNGGYLPNLTSDEKGDDLIANAKYFFDADNMSFKASPNGHSGTDEIKFLRLGFSDNSPKAIQRVNKSQDLSVSWAAELRGMIHNWLQV